MIQAKPDIFDTQLLNKNEGLACKNAEAAGYKFRVAKRDGEPLMLTQEIIPNRINAEVKNGIIVNFLKMG